MGIFISVWIIIDCCIVVFLQEMDTFMMLVCTYDCSTTVINITRALCYSRLVECLCEKWGELSAGSISLFYRLHGIYRCDLEYEEEFQNM